MLNSRIRKSWIHTGLEVGLIGERVDTTYGYDYLGQDAKALADFIAGKGEFAKKFAAAKRPLIVVGSAIGKHSDGPAVYNALAKFVEKNKSKLVTPEWNGFAVLQRVCLLTFIVCHTYRYSRPPHAQQRTTSASFRLRRPLQRNPSSSIFSMPMTLTPHLSREMRSLSTRVTTETWVHSWRTCASLVLRTPRSRQHG